LIPVKTEVLLQELAFSLSPVHVVNDKSEPLILLVIPAVSFSLVLLHCKYLT